MFRWGVDVEMSERCAESTLGMIAGPCVRAPESGFEPYISALAGGPKMWKPRAGDDPNDSAADCCEIQRPATANDIDSQVSQSGYQGRDVFDFAAPQVL